LVLSDGTSVNPKREVSKMEQRHKNALRKAARFLLKAIVEAVILTIVAKLLG
jgi:hypothetical protein